MPKHTYASAEKFILSREFFGMKLGLANITSFLESIGSPQNAYKTIHIAGTNGKGSTAAMLDAVLRAQGYKTGLFTSPHLVTLRERVKVNGRKIPRPVVAAFIDRHRKELAKRKLSYFEVITAMGFEYFKRAGVDIAVIETGLGGRLDASNVLTPMLTITTDISLDHMEILGDTLARIAREKAGIIKPGVPHLIGLLPPEAAQVIVNRSRKVGAQLYSLRRRDFVADAEAMNIDFKYNSYAIGKITPSLVGTHQLKNTALVLRAISVLNAHGLFVSKRAAREGIRHTDWPGRFQICTLRGRPLHIFDVSHNAAGAASFAESFKAKFPGRKAYFLTGFVKRKEHQKIFDALSPIANSFALVKLHTKRSTDINELARTIDFKGVPFLRFNSLDTAYTKLLKTCGPNDIMVIIGSHYLVGDFFEKYKIR